jgi:hypothetical protein
MLSKPILKLIRLTTLVLALSFIVLGLCDYINLSTADLGRHIMNGQYIVDAFVNTKDFVTETPLYTNFYSFTSANFPVHNHHWLTGVFHFLVHDNFGFFGLSILNISVIAIAVVASFYAAYLMAGFEFAAIALAIALPLLVWRDEVRPESFSYLLMAFEFAILTLFKFNRLSFRATAILLAQFQLLWINLHVFFCVGLLVIGMFYAEEVLKSKSLFKWKSKDYLLLLTIAVLASLINPFGFSGLLEPLNIFKNYAYELAENQSVFFMHHRFPKQVIYYYFDAFFALNLLAWILVYFKLKLKPLEFVKNNFANLAITIVFAVLAFKTNRAIPVFVFYAVPIFAYNLSRLFTLRHKAPLFTQIFALSLVLTAFATVGLTPKRITILGLEPGINRSAEFFRALNITGPIFNNYDIGGYLIYNLFPKRRVFVDNRPEAYANEYFDDIYEKVQEDEEKWQKLDSKINFNVIYFMRHDMTEHAQPFLIRRIADPQWVPVFVDKWIILFVKNNEINKAIIDKYRLPDSMFKSVKN